jgi:ATP-dependent helicase HrpA
VPRARDPISVELDALLPARFLDRVSFERLLEMPRYLKALLTRVERSRLNPAKDQERQRQLAPFQEALKRLAAAPPQSAEGRSQLEQFRWMVEEYKVSLFAQELGTREPVSAKRLHEALERLKLAG